MNCCGRGLAGVAESCLGRDAVAANYRARVGVVASASRCGRVVAVEVSATGCGVPLKRSEKRVVARFRALRPAPDASAPSKRPDATPSDDRGLPTSFNRSNMKLATLLLLAVLQLAAGFRVPLATPPAAQPLAASRMPAVEMMSKDISVSPIQAVFAGGGAAGVVFAAYCTSTGSPPTGLYAGRDARTRVLPLFYSMLADTPFKLSHLCTSFSLFQACRDARMPFHDRRRDRARGGRPARADSGRVGLWLLPARRALGWTFTSFSIRWMPLSAHAEEETMLIVCESWWRSDEVSKMHQFGELLGMAFQIKDDLFDYSEQRIGKPTGIDIKEQKMTLPLIHALNVMERSDKNWLIRTVKNHNKDKKRVREAIRRIKAAGGLEFAETKMEDYRSKAIDLLQEFPKNEYRDALELMVNFVIERDI